MRPPSCWTVIVGRSSVEVTSEVPSGRRRARLGRLDHHNI
jgi:hypothetical protein